MYSLNDIVNGTGLAKNQIKAARDSRSNKVLNDLFALERQRGREATYLKVENWYWPDETGLENTEELMGDILLKERL